MDDQEGAQASAFVRDQEKRIAEMRAFWESGSAHSKRHLAQNEGSNNDAEGRSLSRARCQGPSPLRAVLLTVGAAEFVTRTAC